MNDGFVRSVRFFFHNMRYSLGGYLAVTIVAHIYGWIIDSYMLSHIVFMFMITFLLFFQGMQHYMYFYKTAKVFGITGKGFLVACHVNKLFLTVTYTAVVWLVSLSLGFYIFTPQLIGIVFLLSLTAGFLGELVGILLYKNSSWLVHVLYIVLLMAFSTYTIFFATTVLVDGIDIINTSEDAILLASSLTLPVLSVALFIINGLAVKNLEVRD